MWCPQKSTSGKNYWSFRGVICIKDLCCLIGSQTIEAIWWFAVIFWSKILDSNKIRCPQFLISLWFSCSSFTWRAIFPRSLNARTAFNIAVLWLWWMNGPTETIHLTPCPGLCFVSIAVSSISLPLYVQLMSQLWKQASLSNNDRQGEELRPVPWWVSIMLVLESCSDSSAPVSYPSYEFHNVREI